MAFPTVAATATSIDNANDTVQTVSLPGGIVSGDLLIIQLAGNNPSATTTVPTGWTRLFPDTVIPSGQGMVAQFYRQADGGEGGSVDVITSANSKTGHTAYRITGHENPATQAPEVSAGASATSTTPDPDSLTPTGGAKDYLWLIATGWDGNPTPVSSPANYSNEISASPTGNVVMRTMERQLNASSEDPGSWDTSPLSNEWAAWTIAIHPPAGGAVVNLDGTAAAVSTLAGELPVDREMAATVAAVAALTGDLPVDREMLSTVAAASSLAGALPVDKGLSSTIPATSNLAGALALEWALAGIVPAVSTLTGDLTVPGEIVLSGVIPATSTLSGQLPVERLMVSTVAAVSTLDAILGKYRAIAGSIDAASTLAGDLQILRALAGAIAGGSTLAGALRLELTLRGVLAGTSVVSGDLTGALGFPWTRERLLTAKDISGPALRAPHRKEIE